MARKRMSKLEQLEDRRCLTATFPITHEVYSSGQQGRELIRVVDLGEDEEGDMEILNASFATDSLRWLEKTKDDGFQSHEMPKAMDGAIVIDAGDVNADGTMDILGGGFYAARLDLFTGLNFGGLQFTEQGVNPVSTELEELRDAELVDMDGDGDLDVVASRGRNVRWFENVDSDGDGVADGDFAPGQTVLESGNLGGGLNDFVVEDLNGDGRKDIVAVSSWECCFGAGEPIQVVYQNEDGSFGSQTVLYETRTNMSSVATVDFDKDGDIDIVTGFKSGTIFLYSQVDGEFVFTSRITDEMNDPREIEFGDVDMDGDLDLVVAAYDSNGIYVFENTPNGESPFRRTPQRIREVVNPSSLEVVDMDGDEDLDIVVGISGTSSAGSRIEWYENRTIGDSNNDKVFNSSDFVLVFQAGEYEDDIENNSTFETGDWNGDGEFDSSDFVAAFQAGKYSAHAIPTSDFQIDSRRLRVAAAVDRLFLADSEWDVEESVRTV